MKNFFCSICPVKCTLMKKKKFARLVKTEKKMLAICSKKVIFLPRRINIRYLKTKIIVSTLYHPQLFPEWMDQFFLTFTKIEFKKKIPSRIRRRINIKIYRTGGGKRLKSHLENDVNAYRSFTLFFSNR